jgi:hypothetical protein
MEREFLLSLNREKFFTEPHYNGFPAILVRLSAVTVLELRTLITEAWRSQAPKDLAAKGPPSRPSSHQPQAVLRVPRLRFAPSLDGEFNAP